MAETNNTVYWEETEKIDNVISRLLKGSEAKCSLLVDKDGHLISRHGFTQTLDTTALAALMAGSFASTSAIAKLVGEEEFSLLFHKGKKENIHFSKVLMDFLLITLFGNDVSLGFLRLKVDESVKKISKLLSLSPVVK